MKPAQTDGKANPDGEWVTESAPAATRSLAAKISGVEYFSLEESKLLATQGPVSPPSPQSASCKWYGMFIEVGVVTPNSREDPPPWVWNMDLLKDMWGQMSQEIICKPVTAVEMLSPRSVIIFCRYCSKREGLMCKESDKLPHHICHTDYLCGREVCMQAYPLTLNHTSIRRGLY